MSGAFKDHFSAHAADYRAFRPNYPPALFAHLAALAPARHLAWDCGTGSGQAAVALADHFRRVLATDASADQLANAEPHPRVEYAVAPAEKCPLPDGCADLVTVAQALHWFDLPSFYTEVRRVCKPGAILAVWTYNFHAVNADVDRVLARFRGEFVDAYWPPERAIVESGYRTIEFPFEELPAPPFAMTVRWTLSELLGYMNTWSATKRFESANRFNPLDRLADEFAAAWGAPETARDVMWQLTVRIGRVGP